MKIVDARSGREIRVGQHVEYVGGDPFDAFTLVSIDDRFFTASATILREGKRFTFPVPVRFMHPSYLFQRVIFYPS